MPIQPLSFFKCLSDQTRLRCVALLQREGRLCVCELTAALALSQPKISRHLAYLRQQGLLVDSRQGQWVFYQINTQLPLWAMTLLEGMLQAVECEAVFSEDLTRLQKMTDRPASTVCCD
jgi:ArsR family transcriptional regulator